MKKRYFLPKGYGKDQFIRAKNGEKDMKKIVKCPLCGKLHQTRGKHYFRCCQAAWEVEKHRISDHDEGRYKARPRDKARSDIEPLIRKILQEELEKQKVETSKHEEEDKLIELLKKDGGLKYYLKNFLKQEFGIPFEDEVL